MAIPRFFTALFVTLFCIILSAKIIYAETDPYNLVPNSSFEDGTDFPIHWNMNSGSFCNSPVIEYQSSVEWSQTQGNTGSKSLGITNVYLPKQNTYTPIKIFSDLIQIPSTLQYYILDGRNRGTAGNKGLRPEIGICFYNDSGVALGGASMTTTNPPDDQAWYGFAIGGLRISYIPPGTTKMRVGLSANCAWQFLPPGVPQDCKGSVWFDDITFHKIGDITAHKFEDINENGIQDLGESNLQYWNFAFHKGPNCDTTKRFLILRSDQNGNAIGKNIPYGNYSIKETFYVFNPGPPPSTIDAKQQGWTNTTPVCQYVTLNESNPNPVLNFGNVKGPSVPYLSQKSFPWGPLEYDHANTIGPFFCGSTIAGCGCAITSSAMLLKYYGVDKSPDGQETNPQTLNDWLKSNKGYAFGALKWPSIATYAFKANQAFGTQKIKFSGVGGADNFTLLNQYLNSNQPVILNEPGHFIIAKNPQGTTYAINDPAWQERTTLESYNNHFKSMRLYEKTSTDLSAIQISAPSPTELFIVDWQNRRLGKDPETGIIHNEIPNSFYTLEPALADQTQGNPTFPDETSGVNTLVILTPESGNFKIQVASSQNYSIDFSAYDVNGDIKNQSFDQTITNNTTQNYQLNYSPVPNSQIKVTQKIAIDIMPQSDKNLIFGKFGILPIAILTTADFDTKTVDYKTVRLGRNAIEPVFQHPIFLDADNDKDRDLLMFFRLKNLDISKDDTQICLDGQTQSGIPFEGCDKIRIVRW